MGYYASYKGSLSTRILDDSEISSLNKAMQKYDAESGYPIPDSQRNQTVYLSNPTGNNDDFDFEMINKPNGSRIVIYIGGYDKYHDECWYDWLNVLQPFLDFENTNAVEFIGEDDSLWRFLVTEHGVEEQIGRVVYE